MRAELAAIVLIVTLAGASCTPAPSSTISPISPVIPQAQQPVTGPQAMATIDAARAQAQQTVSAGEGSIALFTAEAVAYLATQQADERHAAAQATQVAQITVDFVTAQHSQLQATADAQAATVTYEAGIALIKRVSNDATVQVQQANAQATAQREQDNAHLTGITQQHQLQNFAMLMLSLAALVVFIASLAGSIVAVGVLPALLWRAGNAMIRTKAVRALDGGRTLAMGRGYRILEPSTPYGLLGDGDERVPARGELARPVELTMRRNERPADPTVARLVENLLRLLRASAAGQEQGWASDRILGADKLVGWSNGTWGRTVASVPEHVITGRGRGGGTWLRGRYSTHGLLYEAVVRGEVVPVQVDDVATPALSVSEGQIVRSAA